MSLCELPVHSEESEDLAALQALMSPAAYNTWHKSYLSHREMSYSRVVSSNVFTFSCLTEASDESRRH